MPQYPGFPTPITIEKHELRPPRRHYWYSIFGSILVFILGIAVMIPSGISSDRHPDAVLPSIGILLGWALMSLSFLGGKIWFIMIAVKRGQHRNQLLMQRRAAQLGYPDPFAPVSYNKSG